MAGKPWRYAFSGRYGSGDAAIGESSDSDLDLERRRQGARKGVKQHVPMYRCDALMRIRCHACLGAVSIHAYSLSCLPRCPWPGTEALSGQMCGSMELSLKAESPRWKFHSSVFAVPHPAVHAYGALLNADTPTFMLHWYFPGYEFQSALLICAPFFFRSGRWFPQQGRCNGIWLKT